MSQDDRRHHGSDHDLLVRIDERVGTFQSLLSDLIVRVGSLEKWRTEMKAQRSATTRTVAVIVAAASTLTALAIKAVDLIR